MKRMLKNLIHEGDMFGIVSTGTSSISRAAHLRSAGARGRRSAASPAAGCGPTTSSRACRASQGPAELRYRAHVAFSTAYQLMRNLESLRNRRKAVIYISSGYDFNPFETSRLKYQAELYGRRARTSSNDPFIRSAESQGQQFAEADLVRELAELTRAANRANATLLHHRPARPGRRARISGTSRSRPRSGRTTSARRRTACACWPSRPAASRSSTRTTSTRRSSGSTPRRATTTCSATTRRIRIR